MKIRRRCRGCCKECGYITALMLCAGFLIVILLLTFSKTPVDSLGELATDDLPDESKSVFVVDEDDLNDAKITIAPNIQLLRSDYFNLTHLTCRYPKLTIDNPEIWKHLKPVKEKKPACDKVQNWVYVDNGTFRISETALQTYGPITCAYHPILRAKDDFSAAEGTRVSPVADRMPLVSDFFRADCEGKRGSTYSNVHMGIRFDPILHTRSIQKPMVKNHLGYNILMFGFDSVSRMTFMRFLPKTYSFLIKELGAVVMKGYNIVGDGTPAALLPILTGQTEQELPESRRGHAGAETVDQFPWIWNKLKDNGYVTQWAEDMQGVGTFQYRLKGFKDPPVDHFGRPFYLYAEPKKSPRPLCFGSITRLKAMFNWIRDFFGMYPDQPKFSYLFHSYYSHDSNNHLPLADHELLGFLKMMNTHGYLNRTMLIIMTDHGARFSSLRSTYQGKLEERLPFMSIRMPPEFQDQYPAIMENLRLNSRRLTTPFDIHETFEHLFEFHSPDPYQSKSNRSVSLFELVPENRTCTQADVEQHWCACLSWHNISIDEPIIQQFSQAVIDFLNKFVSDHKDECTTLSLLQVNKANLLDNNEHLLNFVQTSDKDGRVPQFRKGSSKSSNRTRFYQIQLETKPGGAQFEVTAEYDPQRNTFDIQKRHLSRMNKYGTTSACIAWKRPEFREICYCSNLLT
ncbi:unnamed protein product [Rotaria socialis]|uniref:DUF229 domain containing protein n=1 Tax=Rotaria socialis TaxID=392032 RepID=A0A817VBM2_9BILA|nr:unnamed protein product [Rotaria socialis]CAF3342334.1 unnamed protein product [Rotaria socialis]CAF4400859.1 unnamed protein product [Rotaria socialis]CAF4517192.1 unnamed protein product [Rotaria socialis]